MDGAMEYIRQAVAEIDKDPGPGPRRRASEIMVPVSILRALTSPVSPAQAPGGGSKGREWGLVWRDGRFFVRPEWEIKVGDSAWPFPDGHYVRMVETQGEEGSVPSASRREPSAHLRMCIGCGHDPRNPIRDAAHPNALACCPDHDYRTLPAAARYARDLVPDARAMVNGWIIDVLTAQRAPEASSPKGPTSPPPSQAETDGEKGGDRG
jgi:hypothetical protein